jgi:hypothetical protein
MTLSSNSPNHSTDQVRFAGETLRQRAQHREIARKYNAKHPMPFASRLRLASLRKYFIDRYGSMLPNDDAGREDLGVMLDHIVIAGVDTETRCREAVSAWAPWMGEGAADAMIERAHVFPKRWGAAELGKWLGLTTAERKRLKFWSARAIDASPSTRAERQREHRRAYKVRKRAERRVEKGAPASLTKPWEAAGVSRRTWYRHKAGGTRKMAQKGASSYLVSLSDTPVLCYDRSPSARAVPDIGHDLAASPHQTLETVTPGEKARGSSGEAFPLTTIRADRPRSVSDSSVQVERVGKASPIFVPRHSVASTRNRRPLDEAHCSIVPDALATLALEQANGFALTGVQEGVR